jgi:murein L,D-transpeptidase YafK
MRFVNCFSIKTLSTFVIVALFLTLPVQNSMGVQKADAVLVVKSDKRLYLMNKGEKFASFRVTFGDNPKGQKQMRGDERTPEGHYVLDYKNPNSKFHKSIHISYPNAKDREVARLLGVDPGGDIMIHGQTNGWGWASPIVQFFPWTDGCIALTNTNMDRVWEAVTPGTPIEIRP